MCRQTCYFAAIALLVLSSMQAQNVKELSREWTSSAGAKRTMTLVGMEENMGVFLLGGKEISVPITRFAEEDQKLILEWKNENLSKAVEKSEDASDVNKNKGTKSREWPEMIEIDTDDYAVEELGVNDEWHEYKTDHFMFRSQEKLSISVIREVSRMFEATYKLINSIPWASRPTPPGDIFLAELYRDREAYVRGGGPANSGGVYTYGRENGLEYGKFMVPFESIGLKKAGKKYMKNSDFSSDTLIHELTHQLMHFTLRVLPTWVTEGSAEYCESIPYKVGRFRVKSAKSGIKNAIRHKKRFDISPNLDEDLLAFMRMSNKDWHSEADISGDAQRNLYFQSYLLFYYFSHLEGEGDGANLLAYFDVVHEAENKLIAYFNGFREYRKKWDELVAHPETEKKDGKYYFPDGVEIPEPPKSPISEGYSYDEEAIKLVDKLIRGRSSDELLADVIQGYKKIGVRIKINEE